MLSHLFDRFNVVMKFVLPMVEDLKFLTIQFDSSCRYLDTGVTEVSMNIVGIGTLLFPMEFYVFAGNTFITPLLMASLHDIIDDVIVTS